MLSGSGIHESDKESDHPLTEKDAKRAYGYEVPDVPFVVKPGVAEAKAFSFR